MLRLKFIRRFLSFTYGSLEKDPFAYSLESKKLCEIVSGVGSLDDMEASLDKCSATVTTITPSLVTQVLSSVSETETPSRRLLRFFSWARQKTCNLGEWDDAFNHTIRVLAQKRDLIAVNILVSDLQKEHRQMETETFCCLAEILVKLGQEDDAVGLFKNLQKFNCPQDFISLSAVVHALCSKGHARKAQGILWHHRHKISLPVEPSLSRVLLQGWCIHGNVKEARTTLEDMKSLGICPGLSSYNAFLRCLCTRNVNYNPSALVSDANVVLSEMSSSGVPPTPVSFNILLSCLGKVRRVKEACRVLSSMQEMGCTPDWMSYYLVTRVLFLTGRFGKGNMIVDQMIERGVTPEARFYHGLIALLCGIDKVGHALDMLEKMKTRNHLNLEARNHLYGQVYDLLIPKICKAGNFEKGKQLWNEATERGIPIQCSSDLLDPTKTEVFKPIKKEHSSVGDCKRLVKIENKYISKMKSKSMKKKRKKASPI
ncbi:pentatricopeptide repeat-containing protein At5g61370, mitochondrial [Aristolochia californica]|uniref:pentatricopeptide repeat-containing protein At5g61370, mitochondrial n=1 Tax=Aristolochia californica TaxID=171875 RepID=UPI0035E1FFCC